MNPSNQEVNEELKVAQEKQRADQLAAQRHAQMISNLNGLAQRIEKAISSKSNQVTVDNFPTPTISSDDIDQIVGELQSLQDKLAAKNTEDKTSHKLLEDLIKAVKAIPTEKVEQKDFPTSFQVSNQKDYTKSFKDVVDAVKAIQVDVKPEITVKPADVKVENDYSNLEDKLDMLLEGVRAISIVVPEKDDSEVISAVEKVTKSITELRFPVANYVLPFKTATGGATQAVINNNGSLNTADENLTSRYDIQGNLIYVGTAVPGSSESASVWTIIYYNLTDLTNSYGKIVTNAPWDMRVTQTYA